MFNDKFENEVKKRASEILEQGKEPPAGHRERFEQRLKEPQKVELNINKSLGVRRTSEQPYCNDETATVAGKSRKVVLLRKVLVAVTAAAAVIAGFVILHNRSTEESHESMIVDVRNYYDMKLEEQIDATKQLLQSINQDEQRMIILANIEQIKKETVPDVQIPDDEYIILIANVYTNKIEVLQNLQNVIKDNI